jgi:hypothetical protein
LRVTDSGISATPTAIRVRPAPPALSPGALVDAAIGH